ncbi:MAG: phenylacetate--CoA ligase family protein [Alphaproteobacteria bacterium]
MGHPLIPAPFRFPPYDAAFEKNLCRASRDEIRAVQSERIRHLAQYAYENVPFYRARWRHAGVNPQDIRSIDDLAKIPSWNVDDQRADMDAHPPFGSFYGADFANDTSFILSTSGTTGMPRLSAVSFRDMPGLKDNFGRVYRYLGLGPKDLMHITFTYATMGAAWACTWAAEAAGIGIVPASSGRITASERQIDLIRRAGVTAITGTASFILHLANTAIDLGYDPASWKVRTIITAGEIASESVRQRLEQLWGAKVFDLFGSVDALTWVCCDCEASRAVHGKLGMHIWEDICTVEILGADGRPLPSGEYGEMCITTWSLKTSPRIRFRTGDVTAVRTDICACGRTLARLMPISGRADHTLRIHAQSIFPMALENAVLSADEGIKEWYAEAVAVDGKDRLRIHIEHTLADDQHYRAKIEASLRHRLNLGSTDIVLHAPGSTASITGAGAEQKIRRIFDRRT